MSLVLYSKCHCFDWQNTLIFQGTVNNGNKKRD
nr:MAG TPA: hypothetical protein [Caudoviricetes sp.]